MGTHKRAGDLDGAIDFLVTSFREYGWGPNVLQDWVLPADDTVVRCDFLQRFWILDGRCGKVHDDWV